MVNKIRKIDSSAVPVQARAYSGPATVGVEYDINPASPGLKIAVSDSLRVDVMEREFGASGSPIAFTAVGDKVIEAHVTQSSTNGSTSFEPVLVSTTLTGVGQVGGRARFFMTTNVALGGWANALKAEVTFGSAGRVTGLASAFVAEMTLPGAPLTTGNYAPLELELNLPASFTTGAGTPTAFQFMSVQGAAAAQLQDNGYLAIINGLGSAASGKLFQTNTATAASHALRILIGGTAYYIMLTNAGA